eukprot:298937-Amphidinium_carterae.1
MAWLGTLRLPIVSTYPNSIELGQLDSVQHVSFHLPTGQNYGCTRSPLALTPPRAKTQLVYCSASSNILSTLTFLRFYGWPSLCSIQASATSPCRKASY